MLLARGFNSRSDHYRVSPLSRNANRETLTPVPSLGSLGRMDCKGTYVRTPARQAGLTNSSLTLREISSLRSLFVA